MTREEALALLAADLPRYETSVAAALGKASQTAFDGALSFHFNTGAIRRATWVKKLRAGDAAAAEGGLKAWIKAGGRTYKGLVRRRAEEADLIFRGVYPPGIDADAARAAASSPQEMAAVRSALAALGYRAESAEGSDGPATRAALVAFQRDNGLVEDGIAGPATRATLARRLAEKRARTAATAAAAAGAAAGGSARHNRRRTPLRNGVVDRRRRAGGGDRGGASLLRLAPSRRPPDHSPLNHCEADMTWLKAFWRNSKAGERYSSPPPSPSSACCRRPTGRRSSRPRMSGRRCSRSAIVGGGAPQRDRHAGRRRK